MFLTSSRKIFHTLTLAIFLMLAPPVRAEQPEPRIGLEDWQRRRELQRIEGKIDDIGEKIAEQRVILEKRLTLLEAGKALSDAILYACLTTTMGLVIGSVWRLITKQRTTAAS
jgi:hypothetical protein